MVTGRGEKTRKFHDGAGLCSPDRWPPERRKLPDKPAPVRTSRRAPRVRRNTPQHHTVRQTRVRKGQRVPLPNFVGTPGKSLQKNREGGRTTTKTTGRRQVSPRMQTPGRIPQTDRGSGAGVVELRSRSSRSTCPGSPRSTPANGSGKRAGGPRGVQEL